MAIEDAAVLGILFSPDYFDGNVAEALQAYQEIRLPRVTKVQAASAKAAININERIGRHLRSTRVKPMLTSTGFSSNTNIPKYKVVSEKDKLTIEEMNG